VTASIDHPSSAAGAAVPPRTKKESRGNGIAGIRECLINAEFPPQRLLRMGSRTIVEFRNRSIDLCSHLFLYSFIYIGLLENTTSVSSDEIKSRLFCI
jgi:hypothetical protein